MRRAPSRSRAVKPATLALAEANTTTMNLARVRARRLLAAVALCLATATLSCGGSSTQPSSPSADRTSRLDVAFALARQQPNLTSLVVAQDARVVRQEYFNGGGAGTPQDVRSVTKSVVSLLVGIALDRGCLQSIDRTIGELLGPLGPRDPTKAAVTVRQLLTMSSGIGGDELTDPDEYNRWAAAADQLAYVWDQPQTAPPGSRFAYFSPAYHVLSPILDQACGHAGSNLAGQSLFAPLGIGLRDWETDNRGYVNGAAGLKLSPTDMIAIGSLVLAGGRSGGQQVVSASWIHDATRVQVATAAQRYATGYGFGWWIGQASGNEFAFASGWGGQFIFVVPRTRLVVAAAGRWQGIGTAAANAQWSTLVDIIVQRVVPAF